MKRTAVKPSLANAAIFGRRFPHTNTTTRYYNHTIPYHTRKLNRLQAPKIAENADSMLSENAEGRQPKSVFFGQFLCYWSSSILGQKRVHLGAGGNAEARAFSGATECADGRGEAQQFFPRHPL